jgi:hypothetical protein
MKTILQHPGYTTKTIDLNGVSPEIEALSMELTKAYTGTLNRNMEYRMY